MIVALALVVPGARADTLPGPKASIVVDADTGAIISGVNIHEALRPASLTKIVTALTAVEHLAPDTAVPVSARTAGMPAHNLNMKEGQVWKLEDVLGALLVSSANDAGMALAERVSGSAEKFENALNATARRLGMTDDQVLQDPSGLDDEFSVNGGNKISARDLAIAARAVLNEPRLAPIVATKVYSFTGPDGIAHRLGNHNRLLKLYDGAIGMKTGYTKKALHGLVAAATRGGRTMVSVILGAPGSTYEPSAALLDQGFATPLSAERTLEHLPTPRPLSAQRAADEAGAAASAIQSQDQQGGTASVATVGAAHTSGLAGRTLGVLVRFALFTLLVVAVLRTRVLVRKQRRIDPGWPHLKLPRVNLPKVTLPKVTLPKVTLPRVRETVVDLRLKGAHAARPIIPALPAKRSIAAPQHAHPRPSRPRPAHRRAPRRERATTYDPVSLVEIDPKLAKRFEILAKTGQVIS